MDPKDVKKLYEIMHEKNNVFTGFSSLVFKDEIKKIIEKYNVKTVLDYGCGKGLQYFQMKIHETWNIEKLYLYDIGVKEFQKKPEKNFDMVITIDVLEHVHPDEVDSVLLEIDNYARKVVFANICTIPAKKTFPDGTNVHLTVQSSDWWENKIQNIAKKNWYCYFRNRNTKSDDINTFEKRIIIPEKNS